MPRQPRFVELDSVPWTPMEEVWPDAPPGWCTPQPESHPMVQEDVLLEGEAIFGETRYQAPAYFCFPANYVHPAVRTETGFTMIVTFSGPFAVEYHDAVPE
jgi:hypothetical protein